MHPNNPRPAREKIPHPAPVPDLSMIRRVGDRLRSAISSLVSTLPEQARTISGMSRYLNVHKATCQRIVEGTRQADGPLETLVRLPGLEGLEAHVTACEKRGAPADAVLLARAAVRQYASLLAELGVSHRGLNELIRVLSTEEGEGLSRLAVDRRRELFEAARNASGEQAEVKSVIYVIRPSRTPGRADVHIVSSLRGVRRQSFARPITMFVLGDAAAHAGRERPAPAEWMFSHRVIGEQSTVGLRAVRLQEASARTVLLMDLGGNAFGAAADIAMEFCFDGVPDPRTAPLRRTDSAARISTPCRSLVSDLFIHKDLAEARLTALTVSLAATPCDAHGGAPEELWHEKFPESLTLHALGAASREPPPCDHPGQPQLIRAAFEGLKEADPADFVGWRLEVAYPLWQTDYRIYMEFPPEEPADSQ